MKGYHATVTMNQNTIHDSEIDSSAFILTESTLTVDNTSFYNVFRESTNIFLASTNNARLFQISMESELSVTNSVFQDLGVPILTSFDSLINLENIYINNVQTEDQVID
jgi:hypothetical protein